MYFHAEHMSQSFTAREFGAAEEGVTDHTMTLTLALEEVVTDYKVSFFDARFYRVITLAAPSTFH
jgi:hypothetical protein